MKKINLDDINVNATEVAAEQLDEINGGCRVRVNFTCYGRIIATLDVLAGAKYGACGCGGTHTEIVETHYRPYSMYPMYAGRTVWWYGSMGYPCAGGMDWMDNVYAPHN